MRELPERQWEKIIVNPADVELAAKSKDAAGIVGMGLDCQERGWPAGRLRKCFDLARDHGLRLTAHAGEDGGCNRRPTDTEVRSDCPAVRQPW